MIVLVKFVPERDMMIHDSRGEDNKYGRDHPTKHLCNAL